MSARWSIEIAEEQVAKAHWRDLLWLQEIANAGYLSQGRVEWERSFLRHSTIYRGDHTGLYPQALMALARGELAKFRAAVDYMKALRAAAVTDGTEEPQK